MDHDILNERDFLYRLWQRARDRRENDESGERKSDCRRPNLAYRTQAMMSYAYSTADGHYYVGYSGSAGGVESKGNLLETDLAYRRYNRVKNEFAYYQLDLDKLATDGPRFDRSVCNCAEFAAASIAISYDQKIPQLIFVAFGLVKNNVPIIKPCENCKTWIDLAKGYVQMNPDQPQPELVRPPRN